MFGALIRSIVYQQLAGSAAAAIHGRFLTACQVLQADAIALLLCADIVHAHCALTLRPVLSTSFGHMMLPSDSSANTHPAY